MLEKKRNLPNLSSLLALVGNGRDVLVEGLVHDVNGDSRLHSDVGNLGDNLLGAEKLKNALVDAHLEAIVGVGTLSVRSLTDHQSELLGGHTDRAVHAHRLVLLVASADKVRLAEGLVLKVRAHLLNTLHILRGQGDADAANLRDIGGVDLL